MPAVFVHPCPPSIHPNSAVSPRPLVRLPRAGSCRWGRVGSARGTPCWWPSKGRSGHGWQRRPAVPPRCHVGGWPFCHHPSLLRARPRAGSEGWQPPGALPGRTGPLDGFCSEPPVPAPGGLWGLGAGPAGAAERDEGRFPKLYFSAGSFRVNELTS